MSAREDPLVVLASEVLGRACEWWAWARRKITGR